MTKRNQNHAKNAHTARRRLFAFLALCLVVFTSALACRAFAADDSDFAGFRSRPEEKPTFWLVDENGAWRAPLPNWSLEEVMRIVDSRSEPQSATPWAIQSVEANGAVNDGVARLTISIAINVADGLVRAPLGLSEGVYIPTEEDEASGAARRGGFHYTGPGLCVLDVDRKTGEYVAIFQSSVPGKSPEKPTPAEPVEPTAEDADAAAENAEVKVDDAASAAAETPSPEEEPASARPGRSEELLRPNQYLLTLELSFAVETPGQNASGAFAPRTLSDDAEYRFAASFPPSLHSQLTLEIPTADAEIVSVSGAAADVPTTMSESTSELNLRGLGRGGERVEFGWRHSVRAVEASNEALHAVCQVEDALIIAELDARGTTYDATIPVRAFGGEFDVFYITLPPDAVLTPESVAAVDSNSSPLDIVSAEVVDASEASENGAAAEESGPCVKVRLAKKTAGVTLRLKARALAADLEQGKRAPRQIAGFSLVGAQKQYGQLRVMKAQDDEFNVTPSYGASGALETSPEDGSEIYSFFSQPFLLVAEGYERETIVDVRPEYLLMVDCEEARLRARLLYSVYGSKVREFRLRLNGWRFSSVVDAENLLNRAGLVPSNDRGELVLPLAVPADGEILLELELTHPVVPKYLASDPETKDPDAATCSVPLPAPVAARVEPAPFVVLPANAVELVPDESRIEGLASKAERAFAFNLELPAESRQNPVYYQTRLAAADDPDPVFVADVRKLDGDVWVNVKTEATVNEQGVFHVSQTMEYRVEYEPLAALEFVAFSRLRNTLRDRTVKCFVDGRPQTLVFDAEDPGATPTSQTDAAASADLEGASTRSPAFAYAHVATDPLRTGSHVVTIQYDLDPIAFEVGSTRRAFVEFFQPNLDSQKKYSALSRLSNTLTFTAPVAYEMSYMHQSKRRSRPVAEPKEDASGKTAEERAEEDASFQNFWRVEPRRYSDDGKTASITCTSNMNEYAARFGLTLDERDRGVTIVDRAWIQSWFAESERVDRVVWRMTCDQDFIEIRLPKGVRSDRVAVGINGERLAVGGDARHGLVFHDRVVRVPFDSALRGKELALELDYVVPTETSDQNASEGNGIRDMAEFPDFEVESVWIRRVYWQLIFNRNRLVVSDPRAWTPEFVVKRGVGLGSLLYRRVPTLTQAELCDWVGVAQREPIPQEANVYLYSRFSQTPSRFDESGVARPESERVEPTLPNAWFLAVNNAFLVFVGSGLVLLLGLVLVYQQVMSARQAFIARWTLVVLCGAAILLSSLRPLLTLLFLQTTTVGVFLALVVATITACFGRNDASGAPAQTDGKNHNDKGDKPAAERS